MPSTCQPIHYDASQYSSLFFICNTKILRNVLPRVPPLKFPGLPCSVLPSLLPCSSPLLGCSLPSHHSLLPPLASSLLSFPRAVYASFHLFLARSIIDHPSLPNPPSLHSRSLPVSHHHFLSPSRPLLPPSLPPSILPRSFLAPRCLPVCLLPSNSIYTVCVYSVGELQWVLCREGPAMRGAETMAWSRHQQVARCYLRRTHPTTNPF